jgi:hypothetical protein
MAEKVFGATGSTPARLLQTHPEVTDMRFSTTRWRPLTLAAVLAGALLTAVAPPVNAEQTIGFPTFTGPPPPAEPVPYSNRMMRAMYDAEAGGTDFWMDRLLARRGNDPAGSWLMTRGRTMFMRQHSNSVIGFGGRVAYYNEFFGSFSNQNAYSIGLGSTFTETVADRLQTPSYWSGTYGNSGLAIRANVRKFITHNNVAVTNLSLTNTGTAARTLTLTVDSPFTRTAAGAELTGVQEVRNSRGERLTTIFPRLSAQGLSPSNGRLTGSVTVPSGQAVTLKVQLGFVADEIPASRTEYDQYRALSPTDAFATHVRTYNRWWADNIPYIDVPEPAIKKHIYYRWWLMRFNYLDADIPGNDFQFPTSIEGVLGYNNAIALTVPMFIDDLKYLRDPMYSYGPWVSTGESSGGGRFVDNPGDPENWSNSYTQYIAEAAWRSYEIHGGQKPVVANLARYAEGDVKGQLAFYDHDGNGLIEYDWGALTGNDADAVSFHWRDGNLDRAEAAYQYSGALAAAAAYEQLGNTAKAGEMRGIADRIRNAILTVLWDPQTQLFEHRHVATNTRVPWKEINNYYPFSVGAIPDQQPYTNALRLFEDPAQYPIFPFYTANQADKAEAAEQGNPGSNNFSQINSTVQFRLFSSVLHNYTTSAITTQDYKKLLYWNSWAAFVGVSLVRRRQHVVAGLQRVLVRLEPGDADDQRPLVHPPHDPGQQQLDHDRGRAGPAAAVGRQGRAGTDRHRLGPRDGRQPAVPGPRPDDRVGRPGRRRRPLPGCAGGLLGVRRRGPRVHRRPAHKGRVGPGDRPGRHRRQCPV